MKHVAFVLGLGLLTACAPAVAPAVAPSTKPTAVKPAATRDVKVHVSGPAELAKGGQILADGGAGLIRGGQILADGGVAFRLQAATAKFASVGGAGVQALALDGKPTGEVVSAGADGNAVVKGVPAGQTLSFQAAFKVGGKVYRVGASLAADDKGEALELDPINTMVEARVRELLAGREPATAAKITNARLARVWTICNNADITLAPEALEAGKPLAELTAALGEAWTKAIEASVTSPDEKAEIKAFMADLGG